MEMIVAGAIILFTIFPNTTTGKISLPLSPSPSASPKTTLAPTPTEIPKNPSMHEITSGDTLESISKQYYDSGKFWTILWNDNDWISDPRIIKAGNTLKIRTEKPIENEELNEKLAKIYDEILNPSPTPAPTQTPNSETNRILSPAGSFDEVYKQAGSRFGVPWEILYGLHHMETGGRDGAISSGYGTGAQGPLQFMPGTWAAYGADGNADGVNDINNAIDAIHGAANYLATHGGIEQGLKSYGGNSELVYSYARSRGWNQ